MSDDYRLVGPPTIGLGQFQQILVQAHSPAAGEAPAIYASILRYGVDPAVVLAIAQHESAFGKAGIAIGRQNLFGDRYYAGTAAFGAVNRGGWAAFPTYAAGAAYTASLLASRSYAGAGLTARTFPTRYAPASDGNQPAAYGSAIVNTINRWRGEPAVAYHPTKAATAKATAKHVAKAAAKPVAAKVAKAAAAPSLAPLAASVGGPEKLPALAAIGMVALALVLLLLVL